MMASERTQRSKRMTFECDDEDEPMPKMSKLDPDDEMPERRVSFSSPGISKLGKLNGLKSARKDINSHDKPAELFRKDLISAMKLADSEQLQTEDYLLISDPWRQEWERGVQVPVNSVAPPAVNMRVIDGYEKLHGPYAFKLPKKFLHATQDDNFKQGIHELHETQKLAEQICRYDLDDLDISWLTTFNEERALMGDLSVQEWEMERIMESLETTCYNNMQNMIKTVEGLGIEYDENVVCDVCHSPEGEDNNEIVFCDGCDICVHQACYGIQNIPDGSWLCRTCALGIQPKCILCPNKGGAMKSTKSGTKWAHVACALWIPEVSIGCPEKMEPITKITQIPSSRWNLVCSLCRERNGSCIQCCVKTCKTAFHVTCAFQHNLDMKTILDEDHDDVQLKAYCQKHTKNKNGELTPRKEGPRTPRKESEMTEEEKTELRSHRLQELEGEFHTCVTSQEVAEALKMDEDTLDFFHRYWILKRKANHSQPLLLPKTAEGDLLNKQREDSLVARMKMFIHLRQDLERVRNLCYMVGRREKTRRQLYRMKETIFHSQVELLDQEDTSRFGKRELAAILRAHKLPQEKLYDDYSGILHHAQQVDAVAAAEEAEDEEMAALDRPRMRFKGKDGRGRGRPAKEDRGSGSAKEKGLDKNKQSAALLQARSSPRLTKMNGSVIANLTKAKGFNIENSKVESAKRSLTESFNPVDSNAPESRTSSRASSEHGGDPDSPCSSVKDVKLDGNESSDVGASDMLSLSSAVETSETGGLLSGRRRWRRRRKRGGRRYVLSKPVLESVKAPENSAIEENQSELVLQLPESETSMSQVDDEPSPGNSPVKEEEEELVVVDDSSSEQNLCEPKPSKESAETSPIEEPAEVVTPEAETTPSRRKSRHVSPLKEEVEVLAPKEVFTERRLRDRKSLSRHSSGEDLEGNVKEEPKEVKEIIEEEREDEEVEELGIEELEEEEAEIRALKEIFTERKLRERKPPTKSTSGDDTSGESPKKSKEKPSPKETPSPKEKPSPKQKPSPKEKPSPKKSPESKSTVKAIAKGNSDSGKDRLPEIFDSSVVEEHAVVPKELQLEKRKDSLGTLDDEAPVEIDVTGDGGGEDLCVEKESPIVESATLTSESPPELGIVVKTESKEGSVEPFSDLETVDSETIAMSIKEEDSLGHPPVEMRLRERRSTSSVRTEVSPGRQVSVKAGKESPGSRRSSQRLRGLGINGLVSRSQLVVDQTIRDKVHEKLGRNSHSRRVFRNCHANMTQVKLDRYRRNSMPDTRILTQENLVDHVAMAAAGRLMTKENDTPSNGSLLHRFHSPASPVLSSRSSHSPQKSLSVSSSCNSLDVTTPTRRAKLCAEQINPGRSTPETRSARRKIDSDLESDVSDRNFECVDGEISVRSSRDNTPEREAGSYSFRSSQRELPFGRLALEKKLASKLRSGQSSRCDSEGSTSDMSLVNGDDDSGSDYSPSDVISDRSGYSARVIRKRRRTHTGRKVVHIDDSSRDSNLSGYSTRSKLNDCNSKSVGAFPS